MLSPEEYNILRLSRSKNVGPATFFKILKLFNGVVEDAVDNIDEFNRRSKAKNPVILTSRCEIDNEIVACSSIGAKIITYKSSIYPSLLKEIDNFPPALTILGDVSLLEKKSISIIGSRNASSNGCNFARRISKELGEHGYVVTSGFASGIDTFAHRGALETGTIAVLGGGIDHIYPSGNEELYYQIKNRGLIISESPFNSAPRAENFPSRNRIVSGLSVAVVVIEAGARSGTIHTARQAIDQNRELLVAPGNPYDPRCEGSNNLLKSGATPITDVDDIICEIETLKVSREKEPKLLFDNFEKSFLNEDVDDLECSKKEIFDIKEFILSKLNYTPISIDELSICLDIDVQILSVNLIELELDDRVFIDMGSVRLCDIK